MFPGPGPRSGLLRASYSQRLAHRVSVGAVSDGRRLYLVSDRGLVVASRVTDGRILWTRSTRAGALTPPGLAAGRLYMGDRTGRVWCLDAATGAVGWRRNVAGAVRALLPQADRVVVGTHGGRLVALAATSGGVLWQLRGRRPFVGLAGSADGSVVVATSFDRKVRLLDAGSGKERWAVTLPNSSRVAPVVAARAVYVMGASGRLTRLDRHRGERVWTSENLGFDSYPPAVAGGRVYVAARKRLLYSLEAATGGIHWVKPLSGVPGAPPVVARGAIFLVTREPRLIAIRADTGGHYLSRALPGRVLAEPIPVGRGMLLVDSRGIATLYREK